MSLLQGELPTAEGVPLPTGDAPILACDYSLAYLNRP